MKYIKIFVLLLFSNSIFCQSNIDSVIVKNKVKESRIYNSKNKLVSVSRYDEKGKLIFTSKDDFAYSLKTSEAIFYNENGKVIKTISTHSSFPKPTIWIYEYDENNNIQFIKDENGNLIFQYFYDNSNFKIKELTYEDGKISETTTYESQNNGKVLIQIIKGNFIQDRKNITYFDNDNNEIKSESYDFGKLRFSTETINNNGKEVKVIFNETNGKSGNNFYYDNKNRLQKRQLFDIENDNEILGAFETFEYFENDLIKIYKENIYSIKGEKNRFEYDFYK